MEDDKYGTILQKMLRTDRCLGALSTLERMNKVALGHLILPIAEKEERRLTVTAVLHFTPTP